MAKLLSAFDPSSLGSFGINATEGEGFLGGVRNIAETLSRIRLYPYFDACHFLLMALAVREESIHADRMNISFVFVCFFLTYY